ncbi:MAG: four helix bundle protein [Prolixibacteraceae bacterium]|nr:four helix bundle protein [Prolixibacteraceae bacterium]
MENSDQIQFREDLKIRLRQFVLDLIDACKNLPKSEEATIIKRQLLRSGSSVYANYRAANRARSKAEFFSKLCIVVEEADETEMWLDLLIHSNISNSQETINLYNESLEILKIMVTIRKRSKG